MFVKDTGIGSWGLPNSAGAVGFRMPDHVAESYFSLPPGEVLEYFGLSLNERDRLATMNDTWGAGFEVIARVLRAAADQDVEINDLRVQDLSGV